MAGQLYLAANLVSQTFIYGHLQIVYADAEGNLLEAESTSPGFPYFFGDWAYSDFGRRHDLQDNTPHYGDPDAYATIGLDLRPEQEADTVWELLGQVHASLVAGDHGLDYDIRQNSNSYATSLLSVVGIDISDYASAVETGDIRGFPGIETNIFEGAKTGGLFSDNDTAIPLTLAGTAGNDYIITGIGDDDLRGAAGRDEIHAGGGDDLLRGGTQADRLFGDAGNDKVYGNTQADRLFGASGNDSLYGGKGHDRVYGGSGQDLIVGGRGNDLLFGQKGDDVLSGNAGADRINGGSGDDTLTGGAASDCFKFTGNFGCDVITDFASTDELEKIDLSEVSGLTSFADLTDPTSPHMFMDGADVIIDDFANNTIRIVGVSLADMDATDFMF